MSKKITKEQAQAGAKWWADQLRNGAKLDNGDPSPVGGMVFIVAHMLQQSERKALSEEKIAAFETILATKLEADAPTWGFGVDYNPDTILSDAAEEAGIPAGQTLFPWKTTMWFDKGGVQVACGYSASPVDILLSGEQLP